MGARRLCLLLRLYGISPEYVADLVELETRATTEDLPSDPEELLAEGVAAWRRGDIARTLGCMFTLQDHEGTDLIFRQRVKITFANYARNLGKFRLAKEIVDDLLCEPPHESLRWRALVLASSLWRLLGSTDMAEACVGQARQNTRPDDHNAYAQVLHQEANTLFAAGKPERAIESIRNALRHYRERDDSHGEVAALLLQARIHRQQAETRRGLAAVKKALKIATEAGQELQVAYAHLEAGRLHAAEGEHDKAVESFTQGLGRATILGEEDGQFYAQHGLWKAHAALGSTEKADLALKAATLLARSRDEPSAEADEIRALQRSDGGKSARVS